MKTLNLFIMLLIFCQSITLKIMASDFKSHTHASNITSLKKQYQYDLLNENLKTNKMDINNDDFDIYYQSPWLAFLISYIIPGGGQFYNGEIGKGIGFMGAFIVGMGLIYVGAWNQEEDNGVLLDSGFILTAGSYIWQLLDAPISANRINRENHIKNLELVSYKIKGYKFSLSYGQEYNRYSLKMDFNF